MELLIACNLDVHGVGVSGCAETGDHPGPRCPVLRVVNETGLVCLDQSGHIRTAGWARGVADTLAWVQATAGDQPALLFVDTRWWVDNQSGQREASGRSGKRGRAGCS